MKLNQEVKKLIDELIKVNQNIYSLYEKLYNLELENKIDSLEYLTILSYIKMVKEELEVDLYNKFISLDYEVKSNILDYLKKKESNLIDLKSNLRITNSILYDLKYSFSTHVVADVFDKVFDEFNLNSDFKESIDNSVYSCSEVHTTLESDLNNLTLHFLEDEIQKSSDKKSLLKTKYDFIFTKKEYEDELIGNNFKPSIYPKVFTCGQLYNLDLDFIKNVVDRYLNILLLREFNDILGKNNSKKQLIYKKAYIRSLFTLMSEEELENQNYIFNELLENEEYIKEYPNNQENEEILRRLFRNINNDKKKVFTLK